jgi:hypothetical protein
LQVGAFSQPVHQVGECLGWDAPAGADVHRLQDAGLEQFVQLAAANAEGPGRLGRGQQDRFGSSGYPFAAQLCAVVDNVVRRPDRWPVPRQLAGGHGLKAGGRQLRRQVGELVVVAACWVGVVGQVEVVGAASAGQPDVAGLPGERAGAVEQGVSTVAPWALWQVRA